MAQPRAEIRLEAKERGAVAALQRFGKAYGQMAMAINQSMEVIGKVAGGVAKSISLVSGAITEAVQLSGIQIKAEKELAAVLRAKGQYTEEQYKSMLDYASAIQQVTTYGDEEVLGIQKRLAARDIEASKINQATKMYIGYREAGVEAEAAAKGVEALMKGKAADALREYGLEWQNVGKAIDQANKFFGIAESKANTFDGRLKQFKNALGDMKEAFGDAFSKSTVFQEIVDIATDAVSDFTGGVKEAGLAATIDKLGISLSRFIAGVLPGVLAMAKLADMIGHSASFWKKVLTGGDPVEKLIKDKEAQIADYLARKPWLLNIDGTDNATYMAKPERSTGALQLVAMREELFELQKRANTNMFDQNNLIMAMTAAFEKATARLEALASGKAPPASITLEEETIKGNPGGGSGGLAGPNRLDAAMANLDKEMAFREHHRQLLDAELEADRQREERRAQIIKEGNDKLAQYWEDRYNYQREMEEKQNKSAEDSTSEYSNILNQGVALAVQGLASGIGNAATALVEGDKLVNVVRNMVGGIVTSLGQMLIYAGTASLAAMAIPGVGAILGLTSPMGPKGALAAIAVGTGLVVAGSAMSKSGAAAPASTPASRAAASSGPSAGRIGGFNAESVESQRSPTVINISFRGPVTNPKRVAREIEDALMGAT